ncbi:uncharacterized protein LOC123307209 [Coccinella septempunctata]|uniref:uncharacterized protein LOC123307209 n=1 Tax=Coccinella septempunctata TaxID=41139 RepID=UPI001D082EC9|nr:uncharacterized protein LOC123307209 [Coccinella septempunctata]
MSATAVSSYYLWMDYGIEFLKHHSVTIFLSPWILATMFTETFLIRPTVKFLQRDHFWDIETASKSTRVEIERSIKIKRIETIWYLIQCMITGFLCPLIAQIFGHIVYSDITYVTEYYSGSTFSKVIFCGVLHIAHQIITFYSISSYMMLKYIVQSVIIQLYILADFLSQADDYEKNDCSSIREHLKICASHHIIILRLMKIVQDVCYCPILYLLVCGQLVLLCCSIFLYYH